MSEPAFSFTTRARPLAQIGLGDRRVDGPEAARWDDAHWDDDDSLWAGTDPFWLDISCDAHQASMVYGRKRSNDRFVAGRMTLVALNESGWADPIPPEGDPALLDLRAGRPIRVGVDHTILGECWRWHGYIDAVRPRYDPVKGEVVDISAICALAESGRAQCAKAASPVGAGELASARAVRILNSGRWPTGLRSIQTTGVELEATDLGDTVANLLGITADSAGGAVFGDTEGRLVFKGRDWQRFDVDDPVDATIGNVAAAIESPLTEDPVGSGLYVIDPAVFVEEPPGSGLYVLAGAGYDIVEEPPGSGLYFVGAETGDSTDVCPTGWELAEDRREVVTQVVIGRAGEDAAVYYSSVGQSLYGVEPFTRTDLACVHDTDLLRIRDRAFATRGYQTMPRVERVTLDASTGDDALDLMATASPFTPSRYRCRLVLPRGEIFDRQMLVTGISEFISPDRWGMSLDLDWADPWRSTGAEWNGDNWDESTWN